jgi:hypothetical protein
MVGPPPRDRFVAPWWIIGRKIEGMVNMGDENRRL